MAANTVWGLDIGNSAIKAVKLVKTSDGCKIDEFDIVDIPGGEDEKDRGKRVQLALTTLIGNHRFGSDPVYVAVSGNVCLHREFQLPPGSEDKLADLVQYEAKQQIPFPLDQVEWGFERYEDPNGVGVVLIAVRKNDIQDLLALAGTFKLNVRGITPSAVALFNFIHHEFKPEGTTLVLDAGAKGIDFVVLNKRQIYFRTIQIAGREITRVLESKFKVPYEKAEDLKKNIAKSPQADKIMSVIEPTLRQVGAEVQRTIGFYKAKARGQRIQQCYLLGHTFRLPRMADYLQTQLREAPFALVEGLQRVKLDRDINIEVWNNEFPTMAVAIGLAIQGIGISELKLNLLPQPKQAEMERAKYRAWVAAAAAVILVALGFSYVQAGKAHARMSVRLDAVEAAEKEANKFQEAEKKAVAGLPERERLLKRYSRIAHDCGKLTQIFPKLAGLRTAENKPFFGHENRIYLTSLYISRIPFGSRLEGLPDVPERGPARRSEALEGPQSLYAVLNKPNAADPLALPPELRPDVPLVVVMAGEVEVGSGQEANRDALRTEALKTVNTLRDLLAKIPEAKDVRIGHDDNAPAYVEPVLEYTWQEGTLKAAPPPGTPPPGPPPPGPPPPAPPATAAPAAPAAAPASAAPEAPKEKKIQTMYFNAVFRWDDPSDPDLEAVEAATPPPATKTGSKARK